MVENTIVRAMLTTVPDIDAPQSLRAVGYSHGNMRVLRNLFISLSSLDVVVCADLT